MRVGELREKAKKANEERLALEYRTKLRKLNATIKAGERLPEREIVRLFSHLIRSGRWRPLTPWAFARMWAGRCDYPEVLRLYWVAERNGAALARQDDASVRDLYVDVLKGLLVELECSKDLTAVEKLEALAPYAKTIMALDKPIGPTLVQVNSYGPAEQRALAIARQIRDATPEELDHIREVGSGQCPMSKACRFHSAEVRRLVYGGMVQEGHH